MMPVNRLYIFAILLLVVSCATQVPKPKLSSTKQDLFRNESFARYSLENLALIKDKTFNKPMALCYQGNVSEGLKRLKQDISKYKRNPVYWLHVGNCYYLNNQFDKAKFYFKISIDVTKKTDSRRAFAYNNLGILYIKNNHIFEAKDYFEKSFNSDPSLVTPRFNLAQMYIQYGLLYQALKLLSPIERKNRDSVELLASLATIYTLQKKTSKALRYYNRIPEDIRKREDIAIPHAMSLYIKGDYQTALAILDAKVSLGVQGMSEMASKLKDAINYELDLIEKKKKEADEARKKALEAKKKKE